MSNPRPRPKVMMLTEAAAERIKAIMAAKGTNAVGPRIGVKKGGCAGMEYHGLGGQAGAVRRGGRGQGSPCPGRPEMDYRVDRLASKFVFNNPNQKSACGCGESIDLVPAGKEKLEALKS